MKHLTHVIAAAFAMALIGAASPAPSASPAPAVATVVHIVGFAYAPAAVTVHAGDTVTWINDDGAEHSVTASDHSFDSGELAQGKSWSKTFSKPGTYAYYCDDHRFMKAAVEVKP